MSDVSQNSCAMAADVSSCGARRFTLLIRLVVFVLAASMTADFITSCCLHRGFRTAARAKAACKWLLHGLKRCSTEFDVPSSFGFTRRDLKINSNFCYLKS